MRFNTAQLMRRTATSLLTRHQQAAANAGRSVPVRHASVLPDNNQLSEEQQMLRETCANFAENELAPIAGEVDKKCAFPMEVVGKMGELGLMGLTQSEQYGTCATTCM